MVSKALLFSVILIFQVFVAESQELDSIPVPGQDQFILRSKVMNEDRSIWVHMPPGYNSSDDHYPVLYLIDGGKHYPYVQDLADYLSNFEQPYISPLIVVGIPNVDRGRDLIPLVSKGSGLSNDSGAGIFLQFIKTELIPYIEKNYRTAPYRILEGHSLGGLFAVFANGEEPGLFNASVIISPALAGSETSRRVLDLFTSSLKKHLNLNSKFFVTLGDENPESANLLTSRLRANASKKVNWAFKKYDHENHFSVPYKSMYDVLRFIYSGWFMDVFLNHKKISADDIGEHYRELSTAFGYTINPTEDFLNQAGYGQLNAGNNTEAISLFQWNIQLHPGSWNAFDSMGEAYMKTGKNKEAIDNYKKSLELNPSNTGAVEMLKKLQ